MARCEECHKEDAFWRYDVKRGGKVVVADVPLGRNCKTKYEGNGYQVEEKSGVRVIRVRTAEPAHSQIGFDDMPHDRADIDL